MVPSLSRLNAGASNNKGSYSTPSSTCIRRYGRQRSALIDFQAPACSNTAAEPVEMADTRNPTSASASNGGGSYASTNATEKPQRDSRLASVEPTMPAPIMATS